MFKELSSDFVWQEVRWQSKKFDDFRSHILVVFSTGDEAAQNHICWVTTTF